MELKELGRSLMEASAQLPDSWDSRGRGDGIGHRSNRPGSAESYHRRRGNTGAYTYS